MQVRTNAAAALSTLSCLDSNKAIIGEYDAIDHLIVLLRHGDDMAKKEAASAIQTLCLLHVNKERAIRDAATEVVMTLNYDKLEHVDALLGILELLSTKKDAIAEMVENDEVYFLLWIMNKMSNPGIKEKYAVILNSIIRFFPDEWKMIKQEEVEHGVLSHLAQEGTYQAKKMATGILDRIKQKDYLHHIWLC